MVYNINIEDVLFLDIETVPQVPEYSMAPEKIQELWTKKSAFLRKDDQTPEDVYERAGIYAEFGKIICISAGFVIYRDGVRIFREKSFAGNDEKTLLLDFKVMLEKFAKSDNKLLCAHNGKEFDFPYIARRMLINGIRLPDILNLAGKKPWEIKHLDTMELWKFGDYKSYTSLELLTHVFDIPSPKDDIKGSDVAKVYWQDNNLDRIVTYCEKDVIAIAQIFLRYQGEELLKPENIEIIQG